MKKRSKNKGIILIILASIIITLFFSRVLSLKEIDDVHPDIPCYDDPLEKVDVLWVIPLYNDNPISHNPEWCANILALNKTIGMHGVYHQPYKEFQETRNQEYLDRGIQEFEKCFGYPPEIFKPPQLRINKENRQLVKENNLGLKWIFNQFTHKVYHCNDSGPVKNSFIDSY